MPSRKAAFVVALGLQAASLSVLHAQQQYRHLHGDTLRYSESSTQTTQTDMPSGAVKVDITFDGRVTVAFMRGDTVRLWYESVNAKIDSPMGDVGGDLAKQLVGKPFVLRLAPNGRVNVISAPTVESPGASTMMQRGIAEWFPRMPAQTLAVGTEWQDTIVDNSEPSPGLKTKSSTIMRYRVARDSTVSGLKVLVIESNGTADISGTGEMGGVGVTTVAKSAISGTILFAPDPGLLVGRTMHMKQDGTTEMSGRMKMSLPVHSQLDARLELIRK